jgi:hypothetical protein
MLAKRAAETLDEESFLEQKQIVRFVFGESRACLEMVVLATTSG